MTTLALTQNYSPQAALWGIAGVVVALCRLLFILALLVASGAILALVFAAVAAIPPTFWIGVAVTGLFAVATYPRTAVRA